MVPIMAYKPSIQQTQNICIIFIQCWTNVERWADVVQMLYLFFVCLVTAFKNVKINLVDICPSSPPPPPPCLSSSAHVSSYLRQMRPMPDKSSHACRPFPCHNIDFYKCFINFTHHRMQIFCLFCLPNTYISRFQKQANNLYKDPTSRAPRLLTILHLHECMSEEEHFVSLWAKAASCGVKDGSVYLLHQDTGHDSGAAQSKRQYLGGIYIYMFLIYLYKHK